MEQEQDNANSIGACFAALAREMIVAGLRASVTCVDPRQLSPAFAGRTFDATFLAALPAGGDPCGERGEFHTCAWAGPMFAQPIVVQPGGDRRT